MQELLLKDGINVNYRMPGTNVAALWMSSQNDHVEVINCLLSKDGINVNLPGYEGSSPFWIACHNGNQLAVARLLEDSRVNVNALCQGETALLNSCKRGKLEIIKTLMESSRILEIDPNQVDRHGLAPLHYATLEPSGFAAEILLSHSAANVNCVDPLELWTPLMRAAGGNNVAVVKILLADKRTKVN